MQTNVPNYGFNIITEGKHGDNNGKSYDTDESTRIHGKQYTDNAKILQSILKFSKNQDIEWGWTGEKIRDYLLNNCNYYINLYKGENGDRTKNSYILDKMIQPVSDLLKNLTYLELIESYTKITTNGALQEMYRFTSLGRLVGLILDHRENKGSSDLYNHLQNFYDAIDNSFANLISIHIRKCHTSPIYNKIIDLIDDLLENATSDKCLFIKQIKCLTPILSKESWETLFESLGEFGKRTPVKYDILLYNLKLYLEELHGIKSQYLSGFEKFRYDAMLLHNAVTLEGYCHKCKHHTPCHIGLIEYLESYATANPNDGNHMRIPCKMCSGFLDLEFVNEIRTIKNYSAKNIKKTELLKNIKKTELLRLGHIDNKVDVLETIFETTQKGKYIKRSKCFQAILIFLSDNSDRFYTQREIENELIEKRKDLIGSNSEPMPSEKADNQIEQFSLYFRILSFFGLVEIVMVPHKKDPSKKVEAYKLSNFGKSLSIFVRTQNKNFKPPQYNEVYTNWKTYFDDKPFSLDIFCKHYFLACNESGLLAGFNKIFIDYFFNMHHIISYSEIFTNMIFFRFKDDDLNNKKLWDFWKVSMIKLKDKQNLFFHHIKLYVDRFVEKKVYYFSKYEDARFENRSYVKLIIMEAICKDCRKGYEYLKIPIIYFLKGYFFNDCNVISDYVETTSYICKNCKSNKFEFDFPVMVS